MVAASKPPYRDPIVQEGMSVPTRSPLYHLEPLGIRTPFVECITGYFARLAFGHSLTPAALFGHVVAPLSNSPFLLRQVNESRSKNMILASSFRASAGAMNGAGPTAEDRVRILEKLTMRHDLKYLTMLPWKGLLSGGRLIRQFKVWCPECYSGWQEIGGIVYEPLLWSLEAVEVCPTHRRRLCVMCRHCRRHSYHLTSHSRPGYCPTCLSWLGDLSTEDLTVDKTLDKTEMNRYVLAAEQVGELLAAAQSVSGFAERSSPPHSVGLCRNLLCEKSIASFSQVVGIPKGTLGKWLRGENYPTLSSLLRLCFGAGISLLNLVTGLCRIGERAEEKQVVKGKEMEKNGQRKYAVIDPVTVELSLKAALKELPPPSLHEVSLRTGHASSGLRYRFKKLCDKIVERRQRYVSSRRAKCWDAARRALERALEDGAYPSVAEVARRIGWGFTRICRRFPQLCRAVSSRCAAGRRLKWDDVGRKLSAILKENPPLPMRDVVARIGYCEASLYANFRTLCRKITARHLSHRRRHLRCRRMRLLRRVRRVAESLNANGVYPSVKRIEEVLKVSLRGRKDVLSLLREVRRALRLEPPSEGLFW